jgi:hypothetical protein
MTSNLPRDALDRGPVARGKVKVSPAIALADPAKITPFIQPLHRVIVDIDPGTVALRQHLPDLPRQRIGEHHVHRVLKPVDSLNHQLL